MDEACPTFLYGVTGRPARILTLMRARRTEAKLKKKKPFWLAESLRESLLWRNCISTTNPFAGN